MPNKRKPLFIGFIPLLVLVGAGTFARVAERPEFAALRTVDVVKLLGSGACFGVTIFVTVMLLTGKRIAD